MKTAVSQRGQSGPNRQPRAATAVAVGLAGFARDPLRCLETMARRHGDLVELRFAGAAVYWVGRPDLIGEILEGRAKDVTKSGGLRTPEMRRLLGRGLVTSVGESWREQRRTAQPAFHHHCLAGYRPVMTRIAREESAAWAGQGAFRLHRGLARLTLRIVVRCLFGLERFEDLDLVQEVLEDLTETNPHAGILGGLTGPGRLRLNGAARRLDEIVRDLIRARLEMPMTPQDLLTHLVRARPARPDPSSDDELREQAAGFLLAGHETTALTLFWACLLLERHPRIERALRGSLSGEGEGGEGLLGAVIKEAMRLYPPAWAMGRTTLRELEIAGWRIPAGAELLMSQWVVHRDARYYRDPEVFRPERWLNGETSELPKYAYFPFGGGPPGCIGGGFAVMEAEVILAAMLAVGRLRLKGADAVVPRPTVTLRPDRDVEAQWVQARGNERAKPRSKDCSVRRAPFEERNSPSNGRDGRPLTG